MTAPGDPPAGYAELDELGRAMVDRTVLDALTLPVPIDDLGLFVTAVFGRILVKALKAERRDPLVYSTMARYAARLVDIATNRLIAILAAGGRTAGTA